MRYVFGHGCFLERGRDPSDKCGLRCCLPREGAAFLVTVSGASRAAEPPEDVGGSLSGDRVFQVIRLDITDFQECVETEKISAMNGVTFNQGQCAGQA